MAALYEAATDGKLMQSKGHRAGRRTALHFPMLLGRIHAVREGDDLTVCKRRANWRTGRKWNRDGVRACQSCVELTAE